MKYKYLICNSHERVSWPSPYDLNPQVENHGFKVSAFSPNLEWFPKPWLREHNFLPCTHFCEMWEVAKMNFDCTSSCNLHIVPCSLPESKAVLEAQNQKASVPASYLQLLRENTTKIRLLAKEDKRHICHLPTTPHIWVRALFEFGSQNPSLEYGKWHQIIKCRIRLYP